MATCSMDKLMELKLINDYLVRDSQEKDKLLQRCVEELRHCGCGAVSSSLLQDLARVTDHITSHGYQNLFSKTLTCPDDTGPPTTDVLGEKLSLPDQDIKPIIFTHTDDVPALPTAITSTASMSIGTRIIEYNSDDDSATHIIIEDITESSDQDWMSALGNANFTDAQKQVQLTTISLPGYPQTADTPEAVSVSRAETSSALAALQAIAEVDGEQVPVIMYQHLTEEGDIIVVTPTTCGQQQSEQITIITEDHSTTLLGHNDIGVMAPEEKTFEDYFETEDEKLKLTQLIQMPTDRAVREKPYQCPVCEKNFLTHQSLKQHLWTHDDARSSQNKCDICGKCFGKLAHLNKHMKTHYGSVDGYPCSICNKILTQKGILTRHMKIHKKERPYSCLICSKKFNQYSHAKRHMALHSNRRHKCTLCPRTFPRADLLDKHINVHERLSLKDERNTEPIGCKGRIIKNKAKRSKACRYCPEKFKTKAELDAHDETHAEDRPFKCDICGLRCVRKRNFSFHKATHSKTASCMCDICGRTFRTAFWLGNHIKEHKGEKNFTCEKCGESFIAKHALSRHLYYQHGVKPRRDCLSCGEQFSSLKELSHHRARLHGNQYKCRKCSESFDSLGGFIRHRQIHKPDIPLSNGNKEPAEDQGGKLRKRVAKNGEKKLKSNSESDDDTEINDSITDKTGSQDIEHDMEDLEYVPDVEYSTKKSKCPMCNKFLHPNSLNKHIRNHTAMSAPTTRSGKARPPCSVCGRLVSVTSMFTHMRGHIQRGEAKQKPAKDDGKFRKPCKVCGKLCTPASLSRHVLTHVAARPYNCDLCGKKFTQGHHVTRHKQTQHPE